jgi:dihydrofolate reductase
MAGKVFFSVTMSLDGFIAPEERTDDPDVQRWMAQWMELQQWIFPQRFFRENLKLGEGGEEGRDNDIARETFERTGASVMGKRMFDLGPQSWPEDAPFHTPVFVVTHEKRETGSGRVGPPSISSTTESSPRSTGAVRLRSPPVRGRGRRPRGPGADPLGADAAGDPPDVRSPGAVTVSTSALPRRGLHQAIRSARDTMIPSGPRT